MIIKATTKLVRVTADQSVKHPLHAFGVDRNLKKGDLIIIDGGWNEAQMTCHYQTSNKRFSVAMKDLDDVENVKETMTGKTIAILHPFMSEHDAAGRPFIDGQKHKVKSFEMGEQSYDVRFNGSSDIVFYIIGIFPDEASGKCTCPSKLLFQSGCRCGFMKRKKP